MLECGKTPPDLRCTKVPTISLIPHFKMLKLLGISAGHERPLVPTIDPGHTLVTRIFSWHKRGMVGIKIGVASQR